MEVNTLSPLRNTIEAFNFVEGDRMLTKTPATEVFAECEVIPSIYGNALPSGPLAKEVFGELLGKLVTSLKNAGNVDGVWLYLHGALEVDGAGSGDLAIVKALREVTGYNIPYAVALDFHANNDEDIVNHCNIICGYRTAPHADMEATQIKAAKLLLYCLRNKIMPRCIIKTIPAIVAGDTIITAETPYQILDKRLREIDNDSRILNISFFSGQNWADVPNNHASVVVCYANEQENIAVANGYAGEIAGIYWNIKAKFKFQVETYMPEEALKRCMEYTDSPVFCSDSGDNVTAGAGGGSTLLLSLAIKLGMKKTLFAGIYSPELYEQCKRGTINGATVKKHCEILSWSDEPAGGGFLITMGGIDVIVTENRCGFISPEIIESGGVKIGEYNIIVVKLGYLYPKLAEIAKKAILAFTPGDSCVDIKQLKFKNIKRPCYPFDVF